MTLLGAEKTWDEKWVDAWRESEVTGKRFSDSSVENPTKNVIIPSLDRPFVQLRQGVPEDCNSEQDIKKFLKSNGILFGGSLEGTRLFFAEEWDGIVEEYGKWRRAMERCHLVLKSKKGSEPSRQEKDNFFRRSPGFKGIVAQCQTRFSAKSKKIIHWRMDEFSNKMKQKRIGTGLQVTLTTDPKRFSNLKQVGEKWKFFREKFLDFANARIRRAGLKGVTCYLWANELTESGLLHIHIGFYGKGITGMHTKTYADGTTKTDWLFPQKDLAALWSKYGIGEIAWVNQAPVDELCDYVTKHVSKSWGGESNEMLEAFLHYTNMRQWSASKGAIPKEPSSLEAWEIITVAFSPGEAILHRDQLQDEGVIFIRDDLENYDIDRTSKLHELGSFTAEVIEG